MCQSWFTQNAFVAYYKSSSFYTTLVVNYVQYRNTNCSLLNCKYGNTTIDTITAKRKQLVGRAQNDDLIKSKRGFFVAVISQNAILLLKPNYSTIIIS